MPCLQLLDWASGEVSASCTQGGGVANFSTRQPRQTEQQFEFGGISMVLARSIAVSISASPLQIGPVSSAGCRTISRHKQNSDNGKGLLQNFRRRSGMQRRGHQESLQEASIIPLMHAVFNPPHVSRAGSEVASR